MNMICISRHIHVYCTDWQSINSANWTFQNNNFISCPPEAAILRSHNSTAKREVFFSMDLIRSYHHLAFWKVGPDQWDKSKMAGRVRNGEFLSYKFAFYEKTRVLIPCSEHEMIVNGANMACATKWQLPPINNVNLLDNSFNVAHIVKCARTEGFTIYR